MKEHSLPKKLVAAIETGDGEQILDALTEKQRLFCYEFLKDLNASQACLRAGYETNNANRMGTQLKNHPGVKLAIEHLQKDRLDKSVIDASFVLEKIIKSIGRAEAKGNEPAVLRGAELLARHLGMFVDRQEISGPNGEAIHIKEEEVRQNVEQFKSKLASLAKRSGTGNVVEFPDAGGTS